LRVISTILFVVITTSSYCQYTNRTDYDLKVPASDNRQKHCGKLMSLLGQLPPEVQFESRVFGDSAYLTINNAATFWQFFDNKKDGFAIDLVSQDQYQCDNVQRIAGSNTHKGFLLEPVYRDEIRKKIRVSDNGRVFAFGGLVPKNLDKSKIEPNYILISDGYECSYTTNVNVASHGWDLLPMSLYYDTLYRGAMADRYRDLEKTLHFTIPFQKNTSVYKKEDIKPLYDSLKLTDFEITAIRIKAFTSVEGSLQRNMELQEERAKSIVDALQSFQPESIRSEIITAENWVEFLEAINGTSFQYMSKLTKDEIKEALKEPALASKLEPVLSGERKAIIELDLEKRVTYSKASPSELKKYFDQSIASRNINEALYLQEIIFRKVRHEEIPAEFLNGLDIPKTTEFGSLLLNYISFQYERRNIDDFQALQAFTDLNALPPGNPKAEYNICVLQLKVWRKSPAMIKGDDLKTRIESLTKKGIARLLITRLTINYSLIQTEMDLRARRYQEREKWLKYIMGSYSQLQMTDADLLSLSKFLAHNARYSAAEKLLTPRLKDINVPADVLFFYLSLTVYSPKNTSSSNYRAIMLNAVNIDRNRFCHIFDPIPRDGVSFQLLEDPVLKKTWCENCNLPK
jgi:outer membrane protein OmpA-like peptidoglycan-associated protein